MSNSARTRSLDYLKKRAAAHAVDYVESGMILGLGSGSTALFAISLIAQRIKDGLLRDILAVPSSVRTEKEAVRLDIPLTTLDEHPVIDLTVDGADEVDLDLSAVKGGGGAHLREKVLIQASRRTFIIVDDSKLSTRLGTNRPVPVEVIPFALQPEINFLKTLGANILLRTNADRSPFITDQGNHIVDCHFGPIDNPEYLAAQLDRRAGIVEHGLFLAIISDLVIAGEQEIRHITRNK